MLGGGCAPAVIKKSQKEPYEVLAICGLFANFTLKNYVTFTLKYLR